MSWTQPDIETLYECIDATWAPYNITEQDGWHIREGRGGGKRVSAANQVKVGADIESAEKAMLKLKQPLLFMIRDGFPTLEMQLAKREYTIIDPVVIFAKATDKDQDDMPVEFRDEPSQAQTSIWKAGGIDAKRIDVMRRVEAPNTFINVDGATAFAAVHNGITMVHAVEVTEHQRRQGLGRQIMQAASMWANMKGAHTISVIATRMNRPAKGLYESMGYKNAGAYHYRIKR